MTIMIILMGLAVLMIAGIAVLATLLTKKVNRIEDASPKKKLEARQSEWTALAEKHDAVKGYEDMFSGSEAYQACKNFLAAAKKGVAALEEEYGTSLEQAAALSGSGEFLSFAPGAWLKENMDADDLRALARLSDAVYGLGQELEQQADQACVMAYDSDNDLEKSKCREFLEEAFALLSPSMRITYTCPPENGRAYKNRAFITRDGFAGLAGMSAANRPDQSARRKALAADGFRCKRCGRSPMSGGLIRPVFDQHEKRHVALCENCAPRS